MQEDIYCVVNFGAFVILKVLKTADQAGLLLQVLEGLLEILGGCFLSDLQDFSDSLNS